MKHFRHINMADIVGLSMLSFFAILVFVAASAGLSRNASSWFESIGVVRAYVMMLITACACGLVLAVVMEKLTETKMHFPCPHCGDENCIGMCEYTENKQ